MKKNFLFIPALLFMSTMAPACKHGTNDGKALYYRYVIKNLVIKQVSSPLKNNR